MPVADDQLLAQAQTLSLVLALSVVLFSAILIYTMKSRLVHQRSIGLSRFGIVVLLALVWLAMVASQLSLPMYIAIKSEEPGGFWSRLAKTLFDTSSWRCGVVWTHLLVVATGTLGGAIVLFVWHKRRRQAFCL